MLLLLDFFTSIIDVFVRSEYRFIGPGYGEYWYREGKRKASISFEYLSGDEGIDMVVYIRSTKRWLPPDANELIDDEKLKQIAERFEAYLKSGKVKPRFEMKWH
jgi:hypothetical protein